MSEPCAICSLPVNPHDMSTWKKVAGWVGGPRKDSMTLRSDTGEYAHNHCIKKIKDGQAKDQPDIFEEERPPITGRKVDIIDDYLDLFLD